MADLDASAKPAAEDSEASAENQAGVVERWLKELKAAETHEDPWRKTAQNIIDLYTNQGERLQDDASGKRFNILYANTEVLKGALYSQTPAPDCRRRHLDRDPVGRVAAVALQRSLVATLDQEHDGEDFDYCMRSAVFDMILPGRAVTRVKYKPTFSPVAPTPAPQPSTATGITVPSQEGIGQGGAAAAVPEAAPQAPESATTGAGIPPPLPGAMPADAAPGPQEEVTYECTETEHIEWGMFRYSPAKRWKKVRWVAFGELLTRDDCTREFGEYLGSAIELKWMPKGVEDSEENEIFKRALVWTIWNKTKRQCVVVSEGYKEAPLRVVEDPLRLEGFFPCPRPLYSIFSTTDLRPVPEYKQYEDHALQLDALEERISVLTDALRRRGIYDASFEELADLSELGDNKFIGVKDYRALLEKGGLAELYAELPIEGLAKVLVVLMEQADAKKAQIYEVIGISDIMRGATKSQETLGAQKIKDQWGSVRIGPRQQEVQRYARDLVRIHAEIMAEHFSPKTLAAMSGIELFFTVEEKQIAAMAAMPPPQAPQMPQEAPPMPGQPPAAPAPQAPQPPPDPRLQRPTWDEVMQVLRSDKLRGFRVDIETDSTVKHRADDEQKNRVDLLTAMSAFAEKWFPAVAQGFVPKKFAGELLAFGVRGFPVGSQIEELLDELTGNNIDQQPAQQPPELAAMKQENEQLRLQADEGNLRREEFGLKREEIAAKREQVQSGGSSSPGAPGSKGSGDTANADIALALTQMAHLLSQNVQANSSAISQAQQLSKIEAVLAQMSAPRIRELVRDPVTKKIIGATDKPMPTAADAPVTTERYRELVRDPMTQRVIGATDKPLQTH